MRSSDASPSCRLEWRPSQQRTLAILAVGVLAAVAVPMSALPIGAAVAGSLACLAWALRCARREWRQPAGTLTWGGGETTAVFATARGVTPLSAVNVRWRGPLATLDGRDPAGKLRRLAWWPDTLPPAARRALRLASDRRPAPARVPLHS
jgi:toxin CptA